MAYTLKNLNDLASFEFQTATFNDLELHKKYKVGIFRSINTVHGRRILVELTELEKFLFLPERFNTIGESGLENFNKMNLWMAFKGKKVLENGRQSNDIEFFENK